MIYLEIFWEFFQIGLFSVGGGYATLPLIQERVVRINNWITMREFTDLLTISQMTPGPIALNAATFVGIKVAGVKGSIIASMGCITPSCIIVLLISYFYLKYKKLNGVQAVLKGIRPAVVSLIASGGVSILATSILKNQADKIQDINLNNIDFISLISVVLAVVFLRKFKTDPIKIMLATGIIGVFIYAF